MPRTEAPGWISVSERRPDVGQIVWVARTGDAYPLLATFNMLYPNILIFSEMWPIKGTNVTDRVTHWMPIPCPPKEVV